MFTTGFWQFDGFGGGVEETEVELERQRVVEVRWMDVNGLGTGALSVCENTRIEGSCAFGLGIN